MSREHIANTLKRLRIESGLTADEVGEMIGKSGKTVNAWENNRGQPDAEILIQLCDIYKVDNILKEFSGEKTSLSLTAHEVDLIKSYRNHPDMQKAVDRLLKIENANNNEDFEVIKIAARNGISEEKTITDDEKKKLLEKINEMPDVPE